MNFDTRLPAAYGEPLSPARLKSIPQDFIVEETLAFPLSGEGEHVYLHVRKTNANTEWVSKQLARQLGVAPRDVGYAGLKDRHGVTTQWFSLPGKTLNADKLAALEIDGVEVLASVAHGRKLRRGAIRHNRFSLCLRDVRVDPHLLQQRLALIERQGVPNYFDEQRFGRQRGNLQAALQMFQHRLRPSRHLRGLYLSAARAWLFNQILAQRVAQACWHTAMAGDVFALEGSKRFFLPAQLDAEIYARLAQGDIHPTGALWGKGDLHSRDAVALLETEQAARWAELAAGLSAAGLEQDRRPLRVIPGDLGHRYDPAAQTLQLSFTLAAGSYATALLRELFTLLSAPDEPGGTQ